MRSSVACPPNIYGQRDVSARAQTQLKNCQRQARRINFTATNSSESEIFSWRHEGSVGRIRSGPLGLAMKARYVRKRRLGEGFVAISVGLLRGFCAFGDSGSLLRPAAPGASLLSRSGSIGMGASAQRGRDPSSVAPFGATPSPGGRREGLSLSR